MITSAAILQNAITKRYHPILFRPSPCNMYPERQRSAGHHTTGFDTLEDATAFCVAQGFEPFAIYDWNGIDIPAMTI